MKRMERMGFIRTDSYAVQFVSLALFTIGIVTLLGSDDLLAAFAAGEGFLRPFMAALTAKYLDPRECCKLGWPFQRA